MQGDDSEDSVSEDEEELPRQCVPKGFEVPSIQFEESLSYGSSLVVIETPLKKQSPHTVPEETHGTCKTASSASGSFSLQLPTAGLVPFESPSHIPSPDPNGASVWAKTSSQNEPQKKIQETETIVPLAPFPSISALPSMIPMPEDLQSLKPFASLSALSSIAPSEPSEGSNLTHEQDKLVQPEINSPPPSTSPSPRADPERLIRVSSAPTTCRREEDFDYDDDDAYFFGRTKPVGQETPKVWVDLRKKLSNELKNVETKNSFSEVITQQDSTPIVEDMDEPHSSPSYSTNSSPRKAGTLNSAPRPHLHGARDSQLEFYSPRSKSERDCESEPDLGRGRYITSLLRRRGSLLNGLLENTDGGTRDFASWFSALGPDVRFDKDLHNNFEMDCFENPFASCKSLDAYLGCKSDDASSSKKESPQ